MVLYLGRVLEIAPVNQIYSAPRHPYTEALLSAAPKFRGHGRKRIILTGEQPSPAAPPSGCVFRTRCRYALPACAKTVPPLTEVAPGHARACIRDDVPA
jgi:oligopeptide/dipeptide ABC transporter ATP-binding protein